MRRTGLLLLIIYLSFWTPRLHADIASIHASGLPQEPAVLGALDDAKQLEPYSRSYTADAMWNFPVSKSEVAARLGKDLGFLTLAAKNHPDNGELLLLTGLVARYAYNVDVEGSYDTAMNALEQAQKLVPGDIRPPWFRAVLQCQTTNSTDGAAGLLSIEASHTWDQLPVAFWFDYIECAAITNMPAHVLRAASYLDKLHAPESPSLNAVVDAEKRRFEPFDPNKSYDPKDVWEGENSGQDTQFTSTMCGVRMHVRGDWSANQLVFANGSCVAYFSTGPYKAITTDLRPSILVLVQQAKPNETLAEYSKKFLTDGTFTPDQALKCPTETCTALKAVQPGMYKANGDGHGRVIFFERDEPEYPGLIFESPQGMPKSDSGSGPKFYRPNQVTQRIPGKLYYLVLLDAAASVEEPALKDYEFFLQNLTVE
jgi:hypothetical protein